MEDFVPFDLAKKLKEKGFPQKFFGKYEMQGACYIDDGRFYIDGCITEVKNAYTAPTIPQVLKWLREKKKIHIGFGYSPRKKWRYVVMYMDDRFYNKPTLAVDGFIKIEQAALAGVAYCLENLI